MKNFILALTIILGLVTAPAYATLPSPVNTFQNQVHVLKCTYSFATQGGAVSTINLLDRVGRTCALPSGAIVVKAVIDVTSAMSSTSNDGTIALNTESAGDILAAVDADTLSNRLAGIPTGSGVTGVVKTTAVRAVTVAIATHALLGGAFTLWLSYYF